MVPISGEDILRPNHHRHCTEVEVSEIETMKTGQRQNPWRAFSYLGQPVFNAQLLSVFCHRWYCADLGSAAADSDHLRAFCFYSIWFESRVRAARTQTLMLKAASNMPHPAFVFLFKMLKAARASGGECELGATWWHVYAISCFKVRQREPRTAGRSQALHLWHYALMR